MVHVRSTRAWYISKGGCNSLTSFQSCGMSDCQSRHRANDLFLDAVLDRRKSAGQGPSAGAQAASQGAVPTSKQPKARCVMMLI